MFASISDVGWCSHQPYVAIISCSKPIGSHEKAGSARLPIFESTEEDLGESTQSHPTSRMAALFVDREARKLKERKESTMRMKRILYDSSKQLEKLEQALISSAGERVSSCVYLCCLMFFAIQTAC
ncbi:unnamed protein product [Angiostrongylus costaricensis]|uniref:BZIP domain-containing protein n=1 Tax=Angiostrongylus costaricensis TaxID=334426 RepID=A0A0R3PCM9_ANGCS|nr:unnamed protein product [Angiostrongylus costaricensis]